MTGANNGPGRFPALLIPCCCVPWSIDTITGIEVLLQTESKDNNKQEKAKSQMEQTTKRAGYVDIYSFATAIPSLHRLKCIHSHRE